MEYYFDYKVTAISGEDKVKAPKFYFERSYDSDALPYILYAVPDEWAKSPASSEMIYDKIEVAYNLNGIDCAALSDKNNSSTFRFGCARSEFKECGNRIFINSTGSMDQAGVGIIEMFKGSNSVAKFFFAVNFVFKKTIQYEISKANGKLCVVFKYDGKPRGEGAKPIKVNLVWNRDRLPCLKTDAKVNVLGTFNLKFETSKTKKFDSVDLKMGYSDAIVSVAFAEENDEKYYILDCVKNDTYTIKKPTVKLSFDSYTCPYCHKPINANLGNIKKYKRGGTSCVYDSKQKIIEYELKYVASKSSEIAKIYLTFNCKSKIETTVRIMTHGKMVGNPITLDFSERNPRKIPLSVPAEPEGTELWVVFDNTPPAVSRIDKASSTYYSLKCISNNTMASLKSLNYMPEIYDEHGLAKKCMFCAGDLSENNPLFFETMRLLPPRFMEHDSFKIAFMGSTRAGKTTYISRLFGITGVDSRTINMNMTMSRNALSRFGINVQPASMTLVEMNRETFKATDRNWYTTNDQYVKRAISIDPQMFPSPTDRFDYTSYPFVVEVNGDNYVSFYDIAGEDAQQTRQIQKIANNDPIGIFYIINGINNSGDNAQVAQMLNQISSGFGNIKKYPIAVIVTKMDLLEKEFDASSRCLRTDYFQSIKKYSGSQVEKMIDISSEEIRSYLIRERLLPNLKLFDNVKFFGVSSFTFTDSLYNSSSNYNNKSTVTFNCSAKHFELPFIWMMKQFGIIN